MKKTIIMLLAAVAALLSCVKENPAENTGLARSGNYFETETSSLDLTHEGGDVDLDITSNVLWNITLSDGLYVYEKSGVGNASLDISVPSNLSFKDRTFSFSVSTSAEIDEGAASVKGRTDTYVIKQEGRPVEFYLDSYQEDVSSATTSVSVLLTENVGYSIACSPETLSCEVEDMSETKHKLNFSFPANFEETPKTYTATITPKDGPETLEPLVLTINQEKFVKIFTLDKQLATMICLDTQASVTLTENVGYEVSCSPSTVTYKLTEVSEGTHKFDITVPVNTAATTQDCVVTFTPKDVPSTLSPITFTIRQFANSPFVIDFANAANFRYNNGTADVVLPDRNKPVGEIVFWYTGYEDYKFKGIAMKWNNTLDVAKGNKALLPTKTGYVLYSVDVYYSYASALRNYAVSDGTTVLASGKANRTTQASLVLDRTKANSDDRYLYGTDGEVCCKFKLTWYPNE